MEHNLGALVIALAKKQIIVQIGVKGNILGSEVMFLKLTRLVRGKSVSMEQAISDADLMEISDPFVIADAIDEKMRKMA